MRIIAGEFRGRKILAPEGDATRPITDRAKQSVFDVISPLLPEAIIYDCFSGTGSMGLECLSRGSARVVFFESDPSAIGLLKENIASFSIADRCRVERGDLFKWFASAPMQERRVDLIFLDPPYRFLNEKAVELRDLGKMISENHLASDGMVLFRHDKADTLELPALEVQDVRDYGSMRVEFLRRKPM